MACNVCVLLFVFIAVLSGCDLVESARDTLLTGKSSESISDTKRETDLIKSKLESAEGRVRELLADLESFSNHASKAKADIHSSLLDTWKNVELLAKDRCGSELESLRALLRRTEGKVVELEDEIREFAQREEDLKLQMSKSSTSALSVQKELSAERMRRESIESEVHELRDKLQWATATANESRSYDIVAERLQGLLVVVTERGQLLQRILQMVADHHSGYESWRKELDMLAELVREVNYKTTGNYKSAATDALTRHAADLERRLKDSQSSRDGAIKERNALRLSLDKLRASSMTPSASFSSGRVVYRAREGVSIVGVVTACMMTLLCGAATLLLCGWGASKASSEIPELAMEPPHDARQSGIQSSPDQKPISRGSPPTMSPVTYTTGPGSGRRGSTPRRY